MGATSSNKAQKEEKKLYPLPDNTLLNNRYTVKRFLNYGGSSFVYIGRDDLGNKIIIKEFIEHTCFVRKKGEKNIDILSGFFQLYTEKLTSFELEMERLASINSPYVIRILDYFSANNTHYFVMEFSAGIPLLDYIKNQKIYRVDDKKISNLLCDCLCGLQVFQHLNWIHCDIKPDNILVNPKTKKAFIIDLGSTFQMQRKSFLESTFDKRNRVAISDDYCAPDFFIHEDVDIQNEYKKMPYPVGYWTDYFSLSKTFTVKFSHQNSSAIIRDLLKKMGDPSPFIRSRIQIANAISLCEKAASLPYRQVKK